MIVQRVCGEVLAGDPRCPSEPGRWQLIALDFDEHLAQCRGRQVVVTIAETGPTGRATVGAVCSVAMERPRPRPCCRLRIEEEALAMQRLKVRHTPPPPGGRVARSQRQADAD